MKIPCAPHRWDVSPERAIAIQKTLAGRVRRTRPRREPRLVAGIDVAFTRDGDSCIAAALVWDTRECKTVERQVAVCPLTFPYVPGLLSFREGPAVLAALRRLKSTPDALMCDGQGYAHPRRFGLACHLGVIVGLPSVGCGKSRLCGEHGEPGRKRGAKAPLMDGGERIGTVLRTRDGVRPVYVSVGHRIDLASAEKLVLRCGAGYRLPEPTRLADRLVAEVKRAGRTRVLRPIRRCSRPSSRSRVSS
jgi:deoxyribonuclease V